MERITFRELQRISSKELKAKLPCGITVDSQGIAIILTPEAYSQIIEGYKNNSLTVKPRLYQSGVKYQPGQKVLMKKGKRLVEVIIPELDADGKPMW